VRQLPVSLGAEDPVTPRYPLASGLCCLLVVAWLAAGCEDAGGDAGGGPGDGGAPAADVAGGTDSAAGADVAGGALGPLVGSFQVELHEPVAATATRPAKAGFTLVTGVVYSAPTPVLTVWEEAATDGDCRLLTPRQPFCPAGCPGAACVEDDTCQDYPDVLDAGLVHVEGLADGAGGTTLELEAVAGSYQSDTLAWPAAAEGVVVRVEAAGGDALPAFAVESQGVAPLALDRSAYDLVAGQPLAIGWTPPQYAGASRVSLKLDISHHGGSNGKIECETADTGALVIPADLVDALLARGASGFPTVVVERHAIGATSVGFGRIELSVFSQLEVAIVIDGLVSCSGDEDCPDGQTCQTDLRCL